MTILRTSTQLKKIPDSVMMPGIRRMSAQQLVSRGTINPTSTFTRASAANAFNADNDLESFAVNVPRRDYTHGDGRLIIASDKTNSIRNNTMQGVAVGNPGTTPTNWSFPDDANSLQREIIGSGTINGMPYVDIRIAGTPSSSFNHDCNFETTTQIVASNGQIWTNSAYIALVAGSMTNVNSLMRIDEYTSGGSWVTGGNTGITITSTLTRFSTTRTLTGGGTVARTRPMLRMTVTSGQPVDYTIRIAIPQMELGSFASSPILTTTAAVTRASEVCSFDLSSAPWFNAAEFTVYGDVILQPFHSLENRIIQFDDGTENNRATIYRSSGSDILGIFVNSGGATQVNGNGALSGTTAIKFCARIKANDFRLVGTGGVEVTDTSGTLPTFNTVRFGSTGTNSPNGWFKDVLVYPTALSDSAMDALIA